MMIENMMLEGLVTTPNPYQQSKYLKKF